MQYTWDPNKNALNLRKHRISFEFAITIFDGFTVDDSDERMDYGETRYTSVGIARGQEIFVLYTEDEATRIRRIISARRATPKERKSFWTAASGNDRN